VFIAIFPQPFVGRGQKHPIVGVVDLPPEPFAVGFGSFQEVTDVDAVFLAPLLQHHIGNGCDPADILGRVVAIVQGLKRFVVLEDGANVLMAPNNDFALGLIMLDC
jgi:hypothetical protein